MMVKVTDQDFEAEVLEESGPVLVDFTATWCGPCKVLAPILDAIAEEMRGSLKVVAVDIDASPCTVNAYRIRGAPTLVFFENGTERSRHVGATNKQTILRLASGE